MNEITPQDVERAAYQAETERRHKEAMRANFYMVAAVGLGIALVVGLVFGTIWGWKSFKVWSAGQDGRAVLAEAEYSRQVLIEEAKATLDAEKLNAQSEIERAKGAAEAIRIEGGQLTENYIRYLWIRQLDTISEGTIIYVPTEAGLPILEAGRSLGTPEVTP
jgi:regulator of protease activity HflC (stomatin/prohibitin superfamily)